MKKFLIAAALAATATAGSAYAAQQAPNTPRPAMKPRADANRDGIVTRAEFLAKAGERFDRVDTNRDGRIDATERQTAREKWGGRKHGRGGWRQRGANEQPRQQ